MMYQRTCERCGRPVQLQDVADQNLERWEKFPEDFKKELIENRDKELYKYYDFQEFLRKTRLLCIVFGGLLYALFLFNALPHKNKTIESIIDLSLGAFSGYTLYKYRGGFIRGLVLFISGLVISMAMKSILIDYGDLMFNITIPYKLAALSAMHLLSGCLFGVAIQSMIENKLGVG